MSFRTNVFLVISLVIFVPVCFAQEAKTGPVIEKPSVAETAELVTFPYLAEVTGTDVHVRSGGGTAYYSCGKLNAPAQVVVIKHKHGWSKVRPPAGSFSWISKDYVKPDDTNPGICIVTGDMVRVWAGSKEVEPMRSHSQQTKLDQGDTVKLLEGQENPDYYKIVPPTGAYLWISSQFLKNVGPVQIDKTFIPPPILETELETEPETITIVEPPKPSPEIKRLEEYQEEIKKIEAETQKPLLSQNYKAVKKALKEISEDPQSGKTARYAEYQLEKIARFELARQVALDVKTQDAELAHIRKKIKEHYSAESAKPDSGKFIVIGKLKLSQIYTAKTGMKRYLVVDDAGKAVCYAEPDETISEIKMDNLIGLKVGLTGKIQKDQHSPVSLIKFTKITKL